METNERVFLLLFSAATRPSFFPMLLMAAQFSRGRSSVRPCSEQFGRLSTHVSRLRSSFWDKKRGRVGGSVHDNHFLIALFFTCSVPSIDVENASVHTRTPSDVRAFLVALAPAVTPVPCPERGHSLCCRSLAVLYGWFNTQKRDPCRELQRM
jgi:hypothetical protein